MLFCLLAMRTLLINDTISSMNSTAFSHQGVSPSFTWKQILKGCHGKEWKMKRNDMNEGQKQRSESLVFLANRQIHVFLKKEQKKNKKKQKRREKWIIKKKKRIMGYHAFWRSNVLIKNYLVFSFEIFVHLLLEILHPSLSQNKGSAVTSFLPPTLINPNLHIRANLPRLSSLVLLRWSLNPLGQIK